MTTPVHSTQTIHEALRLQCSYRARTEVKGELWKGPGLGTFDRRIHLREMVSDTRGTVVVYALRENWGGWKQIPKATFDDLSKQVLKL